MQSKKNYDQYEFFTPGEICFFFEHAPEDGQRIDMLLRENQEVWRLFEAEGFRCYEIETYTGTEESRDSYSLVCAQLPASDSPGDEERQALNQRVLALVDQVYAGIQEQRFLNSPLRLTGVTPNWYSSTAQRLIDGGPGAQPVKPDLKPGEMRSVLSETVEKYTARQLGSCEQHDPCEVDVYVLDSIPLPNSWITALTAQNPSEYLKELLAKVTITTASDLGVVLPDSHHEIADHQYEMSDHGIFIAGLIHDSAPNANIYLLEVLNKFGVGTMRSLLAGLNAVKTNTGRPTIINCSLMMAPRASTLLQKFPNWARLDAAEQELKSRKFSTRERRLQQNPYLAALMQPLEKLIQRRYEVLSASQDVRIVAAAGNDGEPGMARPPARYPAAFPKVIGVSALDNNGKDAVYSNYADNPLSDGIATFGGAINPSDITRADKTNGIAGVYLSNFPDGSPSDGTARWAGTSFAAGVVSGLLARLASSGCDLDVAERILRNERLFDRPDIVTTTLS